MKKLIWFFSLMLLITQARASSGSHLQWSDPYHRTNSISVDAGASATNNSGVTFIVNSTVDGNSGYTLNSFFAYDSTGVKVWEFNGDSCRGTCREYYNNIVTTADGGAIFVGSYSDNTGSVQLRLLRFSSTGALDWQQFWITPFLSVSPIVSVIDHAGDLVVAVNANVDSITMEDFMIAKFDTVAGLLSWFIQLPDAGQGLYPTTEVITSMSVDLQNNIYACGQASNTTAGVYDNYLMSVSSVGILNYQIFISHSGSESSVSQVMVDNIGNLYVAGMESEVTFLEKYRTNSNLLWSKIYSRDTADISFGGFLLNSGKIYLLDNFRYWHPDASVAGGYWSNQHYMISVLDTSGTVLSKRDYLINADSAATQDGSGGAVQFSLTDNKMFVLSTQQFDQSGRHYDIIEKIDENGNPMWMDTASIDSDAGRLSFDGDGSVYLNFGYYQQVNIPFNYLNKYSDVIINSIAPAIDLTADIQVYPNPFSSSVAIRLGGVNRTESVQYCLISATGAIISSGTFSGKDATFDYSALPAGVYFLRIDADSSRTFSKILLKQ